MFTRGYPSSFLWWINGTGTINHQQIRRFLGRFHVSVDEKWIARKGKNIDSFLVPNGSI
jgi:hypothetical protein